MTTDEIQTALRHYQERLENILTPEELALYEVYRKRIQEKIAHGDTSPVTTTVDEQMVADKIAADPQAAALNKQFFALIGVERLPQ